MQAFLRLVGLEPLHPRLEDDEFIQMLLRIDGVGGARHRHDCLSLWSPRQLRDWFRLRLDQYRQRIEHEGRAYALGGHTSHFFLNNERVPFSRLHQCYEGVQRQTRKIEAVVLLSIARYRRGSRTVRTCIHRDVMIMIAHMVHATPFTAWTPRTLLSQNVCRQDVDVIGDYGVCMRGQLDRAILADPHIYWERLDSDEEEPYQLLQSRGDIDDDQ
jgi:hypothetical protein